MAHINPEKYPSIKWGLLISLVFVYIVVLFRTAWVTEDAYITFRPIENLVNGYGAVSNIGERVQVFTHPLWYLLQSLIYFINLKLFGISFSEHLYFLNLFLSILISSSLVLLYAIWLARDNIDHTILGLLVLFCSKAFMEYSTSGLENPLSHLLLFIFFATYLKHDEYNTFQLVCLSLLAALITLNRFDLLLFTLPALLTIWWRSLNKWRSIFWMGLGFSPFFIWAGFSLFYYGFIFPNTAYAKLNTGLPLLNRIRSAAFYYLESLLYDPLTLLVMIIVLILIFIGGQRKAIFAAAGVILYLAYIFYIGGDYMSGRFFSAPLLVAVILLVKIGQFPKWIYSGAFAAIIVLGLCMSRSPLISPLDYGMGIYKVDVIYHGIADHRSQNYVFTGLLAERKEDAGSKHAGKNWIWDQNSVQYIVRGPAGQQVYQWGPNIHLVDRNGLVDPLLARIPLIEKRRQGHFWRTIPEGYLESLESGQNQITNPDLALYYEKLTIITRAPVFSRERLLEIWRFNTGYYDRYMANYAASMQNELSGD